MHERSTKGQEHKHNKWARHMVTGWRDNQLQTSQILLDYFCFYMKKCLLDRYDRMIAIYTALSVVHAFKINWIRLFYFILNSRKWENSLCVFQRNSFKYSNDQRGKLDWNWLKFYGERKTGLRAIMAQSYKQPNKLSQLQNTQLNLLTVPVLAILKWTEINLRWPIIDGCVKEGNRLTITVNF